MNPFAILPLHLDPSGFVRDSTGSLVLACNEEAVCFLYSEKEIEKDGHFTCSECGRLGQRMTEATPAQCNLEPAQP